MHEILLTLSKGGVKEVPLRFTHSASACAARVQRSINCGKIN